MSSWMTFICNSTICANAFNFNVMQCDGRTGEIYLTHAISVIARARQATCTENSWHFLIECMMVNTERKYLLNRFFQFILFYFIRSLWSSELFFSQIRSSLILQTHAILGAIFRHQKCIKKVRNKYAQKCVSL